MKQGALGALFASAVSLEGFFETKLFPSGLFSAFSAQKP